MHSLRVNGLRFRPIAEEIEVSFKFKILFKDEVFSVVKAEK